MRWGVSALKRLAVLVATASLVACVGAAGDSSEGGAGDDVDPGSVPTEGVYGQAPAALGGVPSVITMTPLEAMDPGDRRHDDPLVDQFGLAFSPTRLLVDVADPVVFRNSEAALTHNVHLRSLAGDSTLFNEDTTSGDEFVVQLPEAGGYDVLCDMHPGMIAFVFGTDAPYAVFANEEGAFQMGVIPTGSYSMQLWTADSGFHPAMTITVGEGRTGVDLRPTG